MDPGTCCLSASVVSAELVTPLTSVEKDTMARSILPMNFLGSLFRIWNGFFYKKEGSIDPSDPVSRYLIDKRHYSSQNQRVKPGAFLPEPNGETSVYLIKNLSEKEIWGLGEQYIEAKGRRIRGRAQLNAGAVEEASLRLLADAAPPRHARIVGWPSEKDEQKAFALELAQRSLLKLRSS
jgi:hypothetical protein